MKAALDRALSSVRSGVKGLRAVLLSASPDGLIAWSWSDDDKPDIVLGFAALNRAAAACLTSLGAEQASRSLLLTAQGTWVASWPLYDVARGDQARPKQRLVITTVFSGKLQDGMVMVYGSRVRVRLREAVDELTRGTDHGLRRALIEHLAHASEPDVTLCELASELNIEPRRLANLELDAARAQRLAQRLAHDTNRPPRLIG